VLTLRREKTLAMRRAASGPALVPDGTSRSGRCVQEIPPVPPGVRSSFEQSDSTWESCARRRGCRTSSPLARFADTACRLRRRDARVTRTSCVCARLQGSDARDDRAGVETGAIFFFLPDIAIAGPAAPPAGRRRARQSGRSRPRGGTRRAPASSTALRGAVQEDKPAQPVGELPDGVGQVLTAIKMDLGFIEARQQPRHRRERARVREATRSR